MDFFQNGSITTLHRLCRRPIEEIEAELRVFAVERPMALILPSLYSELQGPALPHIVEELKHATYIGDIIVGLDQANGEQYEHAKAFFSGLPQNVHILWNDGPWLREIDADLQALDLAPTQPGKGRNVWYCMGYALALEHCEAIALHDCDILTYQREQLARLIYPVANPLFSYEFCKGYYARISPADRERIFDLFYSRKRGGSGLGLPICRKIIENHGGHIRVESILGKGTNVRVWLPVQQEPRS